MSARRRIVLTPEAQDDLRDILQVSFERWGSRQRDVYRQQLRDEFRRVAEHPHIGLARPEFGERIRSRLCGSHIVFYEPREREIIITRIIHQRRDPESPDDE